MRSSCSCEKCQALCEGSPGWFLPGEPQEAAAALGMDYLDFVLAYCIIEYWTGDWSTGDTLVLAPRRTVQAFGRAAWADAFRRGPCALLTSRGCSLALEKRPRECGASFGCKALPGNPRDAIQKAWNTPELQRELETLLEATCASQTA